MFCEVNLVNGNAESCGDFFRSPLFVHVEIEDLVLLGVQARFYFGNGCLQEILFPVDFPHSIKIQFSRVRHPFLHRRPRAGAARGQLVFCERTPFA